MVRNAASAFLDPAAGEQRKTDFAELAGTFAIRDGILTNDDMSLQAPALRVDGRGRVDLPSAHGRLPARAQGRRHARRPGRQRNRPQASWCR